tara:strand:- start:105 stop:1022 length:918 start_codon:yes stop_codon:yes gene_type:complete
MKIFISGGSGMVGKNLIQNFILKGITYDAPTSDKLNLMSLDSTYDYLCNSKPDFVIHCAGLVGGIQANIEDPYNFFHKNYEMGKNLVLSSAKAKIKNLINLGSTCMYPCNIDSTLKEDDLLNGKLEQTNEGYALAKIMVAKLCEYISKRNKLNFKTIIPCNLFGKFDKFDPKYSHMIPAVIRKIHLAKKQNTSTVIWGDGSARREFMYVENLSDFILFAINNFEKLDSYTNVGHGVDYSILDYYKLIASEIGYEGEFKHDLTKPVGMKRKLADVTKQNNLGWSPKYSLSQGIKKTYKYYLDNYGI